MPYISRIYSDAELDFAAFYDPDDFTEPEESPMETDYREVIAAYEKAIGLEPNRLIGAMANTIAEIINDPRRATLAALRIEAHRKESKNGNRPHQRG